MLDASRRGTVTEVTVRVAASWRAAFDGIMTRQQCRSASVAELNEHDGEKLVDGPGVLDLQRASQDDGQSRAGCTVSGRVLARTGPGLKATVAGERDCDR